MLFAATWVNKWIRSHAILCRNAYDFHDIVRFTSTYLGASILVRVCDIYILLLHAGSHLFPRWCGSLLHPQIGNGCTSEHEEVAHLDLRSTTRFISGILRARTRRLFTMKQKFHFVSQFIHQKPLSLHSRQTKMTLPAPANLFPHTHSQFENPSTCSHRSEIQMASCRI